ncbi:hypothetical protein 10P302A_gene0009 [Pseudomonas phage 10P302A]|uniref:Uncharacterized protein n=1 Tax=Pseudomonas phage 10P302A TaxID=3038233 RepID=A0AAF0K327_9CAUD|nr:hypothetical protein 10P302A_gene0009 [Pseudomonas phage 10P302A]
MHTNYQPARRGLEAERIETAKLAALATSVRHNIPRTEANAEAIDMRDNYDMLWADLQRQQLRYSDRGDFTRCYRGGF